MWILQQLRFTLQSLLVHALITDQDMTSFYLTETWLLTKTGPIYFLKIAANLSNIPVSSGM